MNNSLSTLVSCGLEVSAQTLVVALGAAEGPASCREFPNTPAGHQDVLRWWRIHRASCDVCGW